MVRILELRSKISISSFSTFITAHYNRQHSRYPECPNHTRIERKDSLATYQPSSTIMAAEDIPTVSTPAPSYHSSPSSRSSSSSFHVDLEKAILEHLTPLPSYNQDGIKDVAIHPPNTPCPIDEKKNDVVVDIKRLEKSARLETPRQREEREGREYEDSWFTISCTILALIICVALVVGPCAFALYKITRPN